MDINLTAGGVTLALDSDLWWSDEFTWSPVAQSESYSIEGSLLIDAQEKLAGRPITLQPIDDDSAWMSGAALSQLQAWAAVPGLQLALALRGTNFNVMFRRSDGAAIEARPRVFVSDVQPGGFGDAYLVTLRLIEV